MKSRLRLIDLARLPAALSVCTFLAACAGDSADMSNAGGRGGGGPAADDDEMSEAGQGGSVANGGIGGQASGGAPAAGGGGGMGGGAGGDEGAGLSGGTVGGGGMGGVMAGTGGSGPMAGGNGGGGTSTGPGWTGVSTGGKEYMVTVSGRSLRMYIPSNLDKTSFRGVFMNFKRGAESFSLTAAESRDGQPHQGSMQTGGSAIIYWSKEWNHFVESLGFVMVLKDGSQGNETPAGAMAILQGIDMLAEQSGHPELRHAPVLLWGHSASSIDAVQVASGAPERFLGVVAFHSHRRGTMYDNARIASLPMMRLAGQNETDQPPDMHESFLAMRAAGVPAMTGVEQGLPHGGGAAGRNFLRTTITFPWILSVIGKQLPTNTAPYDKPVALQRLQPADLLLGDNGAPTGASGNWRSGGSFAVAPFASYSASSRESASVLPDAAFAEVWKVYFDLQSGGNQAASAIQTVLAIVIDDTAVRSPADAARVVIVRSGSLAQPLVVGLRWTSSAGLAVAPGALPTQVTIPAGQSSIVHVIDATATGAAGTLDLEVTPAAGYHVHSPSKGRIVIK